MVLNCMMWLFLLVLFWEMYCLPEDITGITYNNQSINHPFEVKNVESTRCIKDPFATKLNFTISEAQ